MQDLLQRNLRTLEAPALENLTELANALFVGTSGATDVEMVTDHHDVAAVKRARRNDVLDMLVVKEATDGRLNLVLLAVAAIGAGVGNDGAAASDNGRIFDEAAVGILLECRQHRHVNAALLERMLIIVVLLDGALVDGLAKLGALVMPLLRDLPGRRMMTWLNLVMMILLGSLSRERDFFAPAFLSMALS